MSRIVEAQTRVQRGDGLEFIRSHIETQDIQVLSKTGLVIRLGDNSNIAITEKVRIRTIRSMQEQNHIPLCRPSQQYLRRRHMILRGKRLDGLRIKEQWDILGFFREHGRQLDEGLGAKAGVCRHRDAIFLRDLDQLGLHEIRVVLDLQR